MGQFTGHQEYTQCLKLKNVRTPQYNITQVIAQQLLFKKGNKNTKNIFGILFYTTLNQIKLIKDKLQLRYTYK